MYRIADRRRSAAVGSDRAVRSILLSSIPPHRALKRVYVRVRARASRNAAGKQLFRRDVKATRSNVPAAPPARRGAGMTKSRRGRPSSFPSAEAEAPRAATVRPRGRPACVHVPIAHARSRPDPRFHGRAACPCSAARVRLVGNIVLRFSAAPYASSLHRGGRRDVGLDAARLDFQTVTSRSTATRRDTVVAGSRD